MSSFDKFNSLYDRIYKLDEMADSFKRTVKGAAGGEDGLNIMLKAYRNERTGKPVGAVSRIKNLIVLRALYDKDYINDEQFQALAKKATSSNYIANTLKDINPEAHEVLFGVQQKSDDIIKHIKVNARDMLNFGLTNLQGKTYAEVQEDEPVDTDAKKLEDEVTDEVIRLAKGLTSSDVEDTILDFDEADIYIDIPDQDIKRDVSSKITDYLNKQGLEAGVSGVGVNVQAPVGFYGDRNMRDTFRDMFTGKVMEIDGSIPEAAIKVKFTDAGGTYEDNESDNREHGSVEEHYPEEKDPRTAGGEMNRDSEEESVKQEVLDACKEHAIELEDPTSSGMAKACNDMYNQYGEEGDQEKAEIAYSLQKYYETQSKFDSRKDSENIEDYEGNEGIEDYETVNVTTERYQNQQHLNVSTHSTSMYLTEQTSKDKRNKKQSVNTVSFKERYKPKTSQQLDELRRYGL